MRQSDIKKFNLAVVPPGSQAVSVVTRLDGGIEVSDGSDTRGFVTAELAEGVPTGNFS